MTEPDDTSAPEPAADPTPAPEPPVEAEPDAPLFAEPVLEDVAKEASD